jgi:hypothetical protein
MIAKPVWRAIEKSAHQQIADLRARPFLTDGECKLLDRLKTDSRMRSDVWQKLPLPNGFQADLGATVMKCVFAAARIAVQHRPPLPRSKRGIPAFLAKHPPHATAEDVSFRATWLLEGMHQLEADAREHWAKMWPGEATVSFEDICRLTQQISQFYGGLWEERKAWERPLLPILRRRKAHAVKAPRWKFSGLMTGVLPGDVSPAA